MNGEGRRRAKSRLSFLILCSGRSVCLNFPLFLDGSQCEILASPPVTKNKWDGVKGKDVHNNPGKMIFSMVDLNFATK